MKKKLVSILMAICILFSMAAVSVRGVSAAQAPNQLGSVGLDFLIDAGLDKLLEIGLRVACKTTEGLGTLTNDEDGEEVLSFISRLLFMDPAEAAASKTMELCEEILEELHVIEKQIAENDQKIESMLAKSIGADAMQALTDQWTHDVEDVLTNSSYSVLRPMENYQTYMQLAVDYQNNENNVTEAQVTKAKDDLLLSFLDMCDTDVPISAVTPDKAKELLFTNRNVNHNFEMIIMNLAANMVADNSSSVAEKAAQLAYYAYPFSDQQYAYVFLKVQDQVMQLIQVETLYQEYLAQQSEYLSVLGVDSDEWQGFIYEKNSFKELLGSSTKKIAEMLDTKMLINFATSYKMSLDDYMKPEDAVSTTLKVDHFESSKTIQYNEDTAFTHKVVNITTKAQYFTSDKIKFNRVMTNTDNGNQVFYIMDYGNYHTDALRAKSLNYKYARSGDTDYHIPSCDFMNLIKNMSDGANTFACPKDPNSLYALFDTNAFAIAGTPYKYLNGQAQAYVPNNTKYLLTSNYYLGSYKPLSTVYEHFYFVDANNPIAGSTIQSIDTSAKDIQNSNDCYSVILSKNQSQGYQQAAHLQTSGDGVKDVKITGQSSGVTVKSNGSALIPSGEMLTISFKLADGYTLSALKCIRNNDTFNNAANAKTETALLDNSDLTFLSVDANGYYTFAYAMPYSDATFLLETKDNHVYDKDGFCTKCGGYQPADYNAGTHYYEIGNAGQLFWFASLVNGDRTHAEITEKNQNAKGMLTADIDLENREWIPMKDFNGTFDGQNHTVSNLKITKTASCAGLFGSSAGTLQNFTVQGDISLQADGSHVGGVVGYADGATMTNISSYVNISNSGGELKHVGGVAGTLNSHITVVSACTYHGLVDIKNSVDCIGGVVGYTNGGGQISNCANLGTVKTQTAGAYTGGVLGYVNNSQASMQNCYNYGTVSNGSDTTRCGAVIGWARTFDAAKIKNNYYLNSSASLPFGADSVSAACAISKNTTAFASGEVAWLLNEGKTDKTQVWYQNIDNGETIDGYPVPFNDYGIVYKIKKYAGCSASGEYSVAYSNTEHDQYEDDHAYDINGFCTNCGEYQPADYNAGTHYYEIGNAGQLFWFASLVNGDRTHAEITEKNQNAKGMLTADIDLENREWIPMKDFNGTFDGQNHTVSNLKITKTASCAGLFGSSAGTLQNFTVQGDISLQADGSHVGGVVGYADGATMTNISSYVNISNSGGELKHVGGVAGSLNSHITVVSACTYHGLVDIKNSVDCIGGVVGYTNGGGKISNCANLGTVKTQTAGAYTGGVLGYVNNSQASMQNCYNYGAVSNGSDTTHCGAMIGWAKNFDGAQTKNNYYLTDSSALPFGTQSRSSACAIAKSETAFASGEVAWLLNEGKTDKTQVWYQNIDNGETIDPYPTLDRTHGTVYFLSYNGTYSNYDRTPPAFDPDENGNLVIKTYDDLEKLSALIREEYDLYGSQNYILQNNIIASSDSKWMQGIGSATENKPFNGTFDGNGYCIIGLNINCPEYGGLFEELGSQGTVKELLLMDCDYEINSSKTAGAIAAVNNGTIDHCISGVNLTSGTIFKNTQIEEKIEAAAYNSDIKGVISGGIAAVNHGTIIGCRSAAIVFGKDSCGGITGTNDGSIYGCANTGSVGTSSSAVSGGLAGKNAGAIRSSYNSGKVFGASDQTKGSIAGLNGDHAETDCSVFNVFYTTVNGIAAIGTDSLVSINSTNKSKMKTEMMDDSFTEELNRVTDDSVNWIRNKDCNNGYPTIQCDFYKLSVKNAQNKITVKGMMHEDLQITYQRCDTKSETYKKLADFAENKHIVAAYQATLTDAHQNEIPAELWCQGNMEITLSAPNEKVSVIGMDLNGEIKTYAYTADENGQISFSVGNLGSFAMFAEEAVYDISVVQTGAAVWGIYSLLLLLAGSGFLFIILQRRKRS